MKLFDKLSKTNQRKINKDCEQHPDHKEALDSLKDNDTYLYLKMVDILFVWALLYPKEDFDYKKFKKLFK